MRQPDPTRHLAPFRLIRGALYALGGIFAVLFKGELRRPAIAPILVSLAAFAGLTWASFAFYDDVLAWIIGAGDGVSQWLLEIVTLILMLAVGFILVIVLLPVITGPFTDVISERVEKQVTGREATSDTSIAEDIGVALTHALRNLFLFLLLSAGAALLGLLPIIGPIAAILCQFAIMAFFSSLEFLDSVANRRRFTFPDKVGTVTSNRALYLGFGLTIGSLLLIPFVNLLVIPAAVAGGTKLFLHLEAHGAVGDPKQKKKRKR